jgi:hypothetical protein
MKAFECDHCGNLIFFDNVKCLKCEHLLGFLPDLMDVTALEPKSEGEWEALTPAAQGRRYRKCANGQEFQVCNWLLPTADANPLCVACRLNTTIPDLVMPGNQERWAKMERAKHHLLYTLLRLGLPLDGVPEEKRFALQFNFLAEPVGGPPVLTGHKDGLITMNIAEADDVEREQRRMILQEPYRTLFGHFRHEVGHYYWHRLIGETPRLARFRELFGDETQDYAAALESHYAQGPPSNWQARYVSAYATAHPWEDWAETWAHYLHIADTIETAASFGMTLRPGHPAAQTMTFDPKELIGFRTDFDSMVGNWMSLTYALNSLNRGMGLPDLYPFVLSEPVVEKLHFIHQVVQEVGIRQQTRNVRATIGDLPY